MNTPTAHYTTSSRPLVLLTPSSLLPSQTRISIPVSSSQQIWTSAEVERDSFHDYLDAQSSLGHLIGFDPVPADEGDDDSSDEHKEKVLKMFDLEKQLVLNSYFLGHLSSNIKEDDSTAPYAAQVLLSAFNHFSIVHLENGEKDIHSLAAELELDVRNLVIKSFFQARSKLVQVGLRESLPIQVESSLLKEAKDGKIDVFALFGGQGMNEVYFDELQTLYDLYTPLLLPFLKLASAHLSTLAGPYASTQLFLSSLTPLAWLQHPTTRPTTPYLASCAISLPLIGLTQLSQYIVYGLGSNLGPKELGQVFKGATGHSQGVVSACVIASTYNEVKGDDVEASWEQFYAKAIEGLTILFQIGLQGSIAFPSLALSPSLVESSVENGEGVPTPMLAVTGLELSKLEKKINEVNAFVGGEVRVSLHNGLKAFVVTGKPKDLCGLAEGLRKGRAPSGKDQSKIPHSKRLPVFSMRFLPISVPYHSPLLSSCTSLALASVPSTLLTSFTSTSLSLPVFHTETGVDLRTLPPTTPLVTSLFDQIFLSPLHWASAATSFPPTATHAIDFGTGGSSGIGSLCVRNWEGRGIRTVMLGNRGSGEGWKGGRVEREEKWELKFGPGLVRTDDGKVRIDTRMGRLLRKAPLMVAGMTPCTVRAGFVSAVLKAGYHVELAGGGHYNAKALRDKVDEIQKLVGLPGVGITLNSLYINQRQWTFQLPLWCEMAKEGLPIEGLCVAAGIPSTEKAKEIIDALSEAGIKHVSFKPGSVDGIRQVINIASAHPNYPIILQWTGGRAGGHHSCEDFHAPILSTYASIRSKSNIILVAGSGFGGADDTYPYLTGEWSEKFGVQRMPFDGFLFASRVMVAKEAHTSESVKQLIVDAKGVDDGQWEQTYDRPTGGIMTVTSELGEPIHKVATRGVKLWGEFDKTVFALPREKQVAWLNSHKQYVIDRLNADFQKPWFGAKAEGKTCDLDDMTYAEVNARLVRLMYVAHESRWVDLSLRNLVGDWLRRVEERLSNVNEGSVKVSVLQSYAQLDKPQEFLEKFLEAYPAAKDQILASADVAYFLAITQRPGQKPVPFIPVLDASFSIWFKKDSLWQAEDIEAVFDQDPQRVCILQGPIAVKFCTTTQQPIGELLGGIESELVAKLLKQFYENDESKIPTTAYLAPEPTPVDPELLVKSHIKHTVEPTATGEKHIYDINGVLPETGEWLNTLAGPKLGWLQAFLSSVSITHGDQTLPNPVKRVLAPRHGQRVELSVGKDGQPEKLDVFGGL